MRVARQRYDTAGSVAIGKHVCEAWWTRVGTVDSARNDAGSNLNMWRVHLYFSRKMGVAICGVCVEEGVHKGVRG